VRDRLAPAARRGWLLASKLRQDRIFSDAMWSTSQMPRIHRLTVAQAEQDNLAGCWQANGLPGQRRSPAGPRPRPATALAKRSPWGRTGLGWCGRVAASRQSLIKDRTALETAEAVGDRRSARWRRPAAPLALAAFHRFSILHPPRDQLQPWVNQPPSAPSPRGAGRKVMWRSAPGGGAAGESGSRLLEHSARHWPAG